MGCITTIGRVVLVVLNIVFFLLGLSLIVLGLVLRFGESLYKPVLEVGLLKVQQALEDTNLANFDINSINLGEVMVGMSIGVILGGLFLTAIAVCGWCGACYKVKCFIYIYTAVIVVFMITEILAIGLLYGKPDLVKSPVKSSMSKYKGIESSEVYSLGWNVVMVQFKCCGVDSYKDFDFTGEWVQPVVGVTLETPIACCKTLPTGATLADFACATSYDETLSNGMTGCYSEIWIRSFGKTAVVVPVLVVCGLIQIAFIVFAISLAKSVDEEKVRPL